MAIGTVLIVVEMQMFRMTNLHGMLLILTTSIDFHYKLRKSHNTNDIGGTGGYCVRVSCIICLFIEK